MTLSELLRQTEAGSSEARERLWRLIYSELRDMARRGAGQGRSPTLQTTALIHEAYLRLRGRDGKDAQWKNRAHFFSAAAEAMRRACVDSVRRRKRLKRGAGRPMLPLEVEPAVLPKDPAEILAVDEALAELERRAPRQAQIVKLRYFAGLSVEETAEALGISARTVNVGWQVARAWLHRALSDNPPTADPSTNRT
jgi:RNA polymerase sigma factor (TIGR02999 family)